MGKLEQIDAPSIQRQPQARTPSDGSACSDAQIKPSPCQEGDGSRCAKRMGAQVQLPEDIFHRIHVLMPMRDAAQAACVSHGFLRSWRCYPNLVFSVDSLGIKEDVSEEDKLTKDFISRVDHIMQNHSGMGVKEFRLRSYPCSTLDPSYVDRWLQVAIIPGIKQIELSFFDFGQTKYNFPCSFLSSERGGSIQSILLSACSVHSAAQVGCLSSLINLNLQSVDITGEELYCFLTNSCALKKISLINCDSIICLKIPCQLRQLIILGVLDCGKLEMIESNAPNLSSFSYTGRKVHISLGAASQVRKIRFWLNFSPDALYYACTKLPVIAPNLQTLVLTTSDETVNTTMAFGKFLQLKHLVIVVSGIKFSPDYDFYSLVSFLDASPSLQTFILRIDTPTIRHDSIVENSGGDLSHPRCLSECYHDNLKNMRITGFCSAKSMIELTIHIIEKANSLECLTIDTSRGHDRRFAKNRCWPLTEEALVEAGKARLAIREYVEGRVPPAVNLKIIEPCSKCVKL